MAGGGRWESTTDDRRQRRRRSIAIGCATVSLSIGLLLLIGLIGGGSSSVDESNAAASGRFRRSIDADLAENRSLSRRLPQAIIIGVKKGGTRALLEYLRMHPKVKGAGPEVHFFDRYYDRGIDWYRQQMPTTTEDQVTVEKTPSYFVTKQAPMRLFSVNPDAKLIVVLRNPVHRAISDYAQNAAKRPGMPDFEDLAFTNVSGCVGDLHKTNCRAVNTSWGAIKIGFYYKHVRRWLQYFRLDQLHFVDGERLVTHPASETNLVERFLGLSEQISDRNFLYDGQRGRFPCLRSPSRPGKARCLGKTKGRRHPLVRPELLSLLSEFYRSHNQRLFDLIGRRFDW